MRIQKYNFPDTVVSNPWQEKARDIPDFGDDEFPNMICVESGHVSSPVILLPSMTFEASQILQVLFPMRLIDKEEEEEKNIKIIRYSKNSCELLLSIRGLII